MRGYEFLRKLADGSAAEVFLAREERSQSRVVIEVIRPELTSDAEIYGRFLDEAKERKTLTHPNLLRRVTSGCASDGRVFVVTEPIAGEHLGSVLVTNGPLPPGDAVRMLLPICDALDYLHGRGMVHGNLRPSNVFLCGTGSELVPKLLDTGLSLFRSKRSVRSPGSITLVEPEYLSPERARGERANMLSDVYGLGVLLYEMITGKPPFTSADPAETRRLHLVAPPPPLPERCERLLPVIHRCLAKDPRKRYPSAAAMRQALAPFASENTPKIIVEGPIGPQLPAGDEPVAPASADELVVGEPVGEVLGPYEIEDVLGQGGMGRVFLARHTQLDRKVALKVLHPELAKDPSQLQRFFQEARAVGRIRHEHIVEVYDFVHEPPERGGRVYFVMEHLRGHTLRDRMKKGPVPLARAVRIVRQVCEALQAAHQVGVVHRDIKPDNIFLSERGGQTDFVKVLDFGIAKLRAGDRVADTTRSGVVVGTPSFMAPEQAMGEKVDHRADIYALGTVLYTLLAGAPPFSAASLGKLVMKLVTEPPPPLPDRSVAGDVIPPALKLLVSRTLAKKPADRPQTMAELKAELAPFEAEPAAGEVAQLFPEHGVQLERELLSPTRFDRPRPEPLVVKKRPTWPYLLAGAILAWGLAAGAWWLHSRSLAPPAPPAAAAPEAKAAPPELPVQIESPPVVKKGPKRR